MPQLIAAVLVGGVIWYGYRAFKREMARVGRETRKAERSKNPTKSLQKGKDGVYRPGEADEE